MIVTTRFPDLAPRPETAANAAFRRSFAARWARENVVFLASTRRFDSQPLPAALSLKLIEQGAASLDVGRRRVLLEAGRAIVVNEGESYAVSIASDQPVRSFSVHFRPGLAAEVAAARREPWEHALARDNEPASGATPLFHDQLRAPSPPLQHCLNAIRQLALAGERDGDLYEAPFIALLDRLFGDDCAARVQLETLDVVRPSTRAELGRRAGWAHDFILSNYAEPVALEHIAAAAHLSKFHLLRIFHQVYGATPLGVLRARRAKAAAALLQEGATDLAAVAERAGFGSRWAMQRALRQHCGATGRDLRQRRA
jgi:AraC family transcriptional regulator